MRRYKGILFLGAALYMAFPSWGQDKPSEYLEGMYEAFLEKKELYMSYSVQTEYYEVDSENSLVEGFLIMKDKERYTSFNGIDYMMVGNRVMMVDNNNKIITMIAAPEGTIEKTSSDLTNILPQIAQTDSLYTVRKERDNVTISSKTTEGESNHRIVLRKEDLLPESFALEVFFEGMPSMKVSAHYNYYHRAPSTWSAGLRIEDIVTSWSDEARPIGVYTDYTLVNQLIR